MTRSAVRFRLAPPFFLRYRDGKPRYMSAGLFLRYRDGKPRYMSASLFLRYRDGKPWLLSACLRCNALYFLHTKSGFCPHGGNTPKKAGIKR
jgi:hypothetical protein